VITPRHAAALALVGWYLMVPPMGYKGNQAGLYGWYIVHSYDTAQACEEAPANGETDLPPLPSGRKVKWAGSICVASDDPRLKFPFSFHMP